MAPAAPGRGHPQWRETRAPIEGRASLQPVETPRGAVTFSGTDPVAGWERLLEIGVAPTGDAARFFAATEGSGSAWVDRHEVKRSSISLKSGSPEPNAARATRDDACEHIVVEPFAATDADSEQVAQRPLEQVDVVEDQHPGPAPRRGWH
jgi:hypothetical protein